MQRSFLQIQTHITLGASFIAHVVLYNYFSKYIYILVKRTSLTTIILMQKFIILF